MKVTWVWTIPNALSLFRIVLIPVFAVLYIAGDAHPALLVWAVAMLAVSGISDMLDGMIARCCNRVSEIGKLLDPLADKLTQVTVLCCMAVRLPRLWPLVGLCLAKELLQVLGTVTLLLRRKTTVQAAQWYGKVSTAVFYVAVALFAVFPPAPHEPLLFGKNMPAWLFVASAAAVAAWMLIAFIQYTRVYLKISKEYREPIKAVE